MLVKNKAGHIWDLPDAEARTRIERKEMTIMTPKEQEAYINRHKPVMIGKKTSSPVPEPSSVPEAPTEDAESDPSAASAESELQTLRDEYKVVLGTDVPKNKNKDLVWIQEKIDEANAPIAKETEAVSTTDETSEVAEASADTGDNPEEDEAVLPEESSESSESGEGEEEAPAEDAGDEESEDVADESNPAE